MRVVVDAQAMSAVLRGASGVLPSRSPDPISKCIMLRADDSEKRFEVVVSREGSIIKWYVPGVDVQRSGEVVLSPGRLTSLLAELSGDVKLIDRNGELVIESVFFEAAVKLEAEPSAFPLVDVPLLGKSFPYVLVDRVEFLRVVKLCYAGSRQSKSERFNLAGVSFWPLVGKKTGAVESLDVVGTDGRVVVRSNLGCKAGAGVVKPRFPGSPSLLANQFVGVLEGVFGDDPAEQLCLVPGADAVIIKTARSVMRCACPDGTYPDYADILGQRGKPLTFEVVADDFVHCLRVASICCNPDSPVIEVTLGEGVLVAESVMVDGLIVGRSRAEMPIAIDGGGKKFRLSPKLFFLLSSAWREASMIEFAVNLSKHVAFFACKDILMDGVLVLHS